MLTSSTFFVEQKQPDITFFGEKLTDDFDRSLAEDRFKVDLLLVIGTSLKVSPVAEILCAMPCFCKTTHVQELPFWIAQLPHSIPQVRYIHKQSEQRLIFKLNRF